jgi:hypothetical protein
MTASLPIGSVTSFRRDGARVRPVSVNHNQESGVGSAEGASGSSATTGIIAGGFLVSVQVVSVSRKSNFRGNFYWRRFRMCRSHAHRQSQSQSRSRTAATATIPLRMILRTGPLVGPNSIIPGLPEANAACKKEIGPRGGLFSRCENFFLPELDEPLLTEFSAGSLVSFSKNWWKNACLARSANRTAFISSRSIRPDTVRNSRWHYRKRQGTSVHAATPHHDPGIAVGTSTCKEPRG